jgi:predicted nucleotidyltransferase
VKIKDRAEYEQKKAHLSEVLHTVLITTKYNQTQLAEKLGMYPSRLNKYLNQEYYPKNIDEIMEKLKKIITAERRIYYGHSHRIYQ